MPTAIAVFADSVLFLVPYVGYRHIAAVATQAHSAELKGIDYGYELRDYDEYGARIFGWPILSSAFGCES